MVHPICRGHNYISLNLEQYSSEQNRVTVQNSMKGMYFEAQMPICKQSRHATQQVACSQIASLLHVRTVPGMAAVPGVSGRAVCCCQPILQQLQHTVITRGSLLPYTSSCHALGTILAESYEEAAMAGIIAELCADLV